MPGFKYGRRNTQPSRRQKQLDATEDTARPEGSARGAGRGASKGKPPKKYSTAAILAAARKIAAEKKK